MKDLYTHAHKIHYDDDAYDGAYYIQHHTNDHEASEIFNEARLRGHVDFEDFEHRHFKISHNSDGTYTVQRKAY